jgi:hypothetical protein
MIVFMTQNMITKNEVTLRNNLNSDYAIKRNNILLQQMSLSTYKIQQQLIKIT